MLITLALLSSACDRPAEGTLGRLLPSTVPAVVVVRPLFSLTGQICPAFDLVVTASRTVTLDHVTIEMLDGSNLGAPAIPVPQPRLTTSIGPTVIAAGTTRSFGVQPLFSCTQAVGGLFGVRTVFIDNAGEKHFVTASARL
jgi:hypothetical protein